MRRILLTAIVASGLALPAFAVPLAPGDVIFTTGTSVGADPTLPGAVLNDNLIGFTIDPTPLTPFSNTGGTVQNRVLRETDSGFLTFAPRIRDTFNLDGGTLAIIGFRLNGFGMSALDVDFRTDGLGDKGFATVSRSGDGNIMTFRYDDPLFVDSMLPPGRQQESLFPSIRSDATLFDFSGSMTIFAQLTSGDVPGGELFTVTIDGLAVPIAPVPLPASALLLLGAMGTLGAVRRIRRRSS